MGRENRVHYENAWYHVMNRASGKKFVFQDENNKYIFMHLLKEIHDKFAVQIHAYCLMDNHYHLLIKTPFANISNAIHSLQSRYAKTYNKLIHSDGPVFRSRFKSILIKNDNYLIQVCRYIHRNPIDAKISAIDDYKWSSFHYYINRVNKPIWLYTNELVSIVDETQNIESFIKFHTNITNNRVSLDNFYTSMKQTPVINDIHADIGLKELHRLTGEIITDDKTVKLVFCFIAKNIYRYKVTEISEYFHHSNRSSIASLLSRNKNKIDYTMLIELLELKNRPDILIKKCYQLMQLF